MVKFLGSKPTEWEATVAADASSLFELSSSKAVNKVLSTAGSRAPQKQLCSSVLPYVSQMVENEHGCNILISLVKYGTKQTVSLIVPPAMKAINPKKMSLFQSELVREAARRPHCSEDADLAVENVTKSLLANLSLPNALRAVSTVVSQNVEYLSKFKFVAAIHSAAKNDVVSFLQFALNDAIDKDATASALLNLLGKNILPEHAHILALPDRPIADEISTYILKHKLVTEPNWALPVAACIRGSEESISLKLTEAVLKHTPTPVIVGAIHARFPERTYVSPQLSAIATQWVRSHNAVHIRTREAVTARMSQKRSREEVDEF